MTFGHFFHTYCCCSFWKSLHKKSDHMVPIPHWGKTDRHWIPGHLGHTGGHRCCLWNTTLKHPMNFWNTRQEGLQLMNQSNCFPLISVREDIKNHNTCSFSCSGSCICRHHIILHLHNAWLRSGVWHLNSMSPENKPDTERWLDVYCYFTLYLSVFVIINIVHLKMNFLS